MKVSWIFWWIVNTFWIILFAIGTAFVWLREIDGAGAIQTPEAKLISFVVLLTFFIFPLIAQVIWLIINRTLPVTQTIQNIPNPMSDREGYSMGLDHREGYSFTERN